MRSFRQRPIGWRHESYRHYLASKGVSSKRYDPKLYKYRQIFYNSDKVSPGQSVEYNSRGYKVVKIEGDLVMIERQGVSMWVPISGVSPFGAAGYYSDKDDDRLKERFEGLSSEDKVFIRERLIDVEKAALATVDDSLKKGEITEAQADKQRLEVMRIIAGNRRYVS